MSSHIPRINIDIYNNITYIIEEKVSWKKAIQKFHIYNGNLQRVYIRYIITKYGYITAQSLVKDESLVQDKSRGYHSSLSANKNNFVIAKDINAYGSKCYSYVRDHHQLSQVISTHACVYEVVRGCWKEMYDFDGEEVTENEAEIIKDFLQYRRKISDAKVYIKSASNERKISPLYYSRMYYEKC